jgi:hypothetical protein
MKNTNPHKFIWAIIVLVALGGALRADRSEREPIRKNVLSGDAAATESWLAPVTIASEPLHVYDEKSSVRFHPSGKVYVVFKDNIDDQKTNKRSIKLYSYDGEKSVMVKNVSEDSLMAYEPDMAITPSGLIHIVWAEGLNGNANTQYIKYRTFDGNTWSPIIVLRTLFIEGFTDGWNLEKIDDLRLAVDDDENVFVTCMLWPMARCITFSRYGETIYNDAFPMGGRSKHPSIAADKDYLHLVWQQLEGSDYTVRYARRENKPQSSWNFTYKIVISGGHRPFVKVDKNDVPHVVYMKDAPSSTKRELHHRKWQGSAFGGSQMISDDNPALYHTPVLGVIDSDNVLTHSQTWAGGITNFYNWKQAGKWSGLKVANNVEVGSSFSDCDLHTNGIGAISYSAGGSMKLLVSEKLQINSVPVAKFTVDKDSVFWGETIKLNGAESYDTDGSIVKFEWRSVTDNVTLASTTSSAEYTFLKKWNNVRMRLTAIDDKGGRGIAEKIINVKALYSAIDVVATPKLITTLVYSRNGNVVTWKGNPMNSVYNITAYRIYRKIAGSDDSTYELKGTVSTGKFVFADVTIEAGKSYVYAVSAVDEEGHQSPYVNTGI